MRREREEKEAAEGGPAEDENDEDADDIMGGTGPFQSLNDHLTAKVCVTQHQFLPVVIILCLRILNWLIVVHIGMSMRSRLYNLVTRVLLKSVTKSPQ